MQYCHAFVVFKSKDTNAFAIGIWFNLEVDKVKQLIVKPYNEGKTFPFYGRMVNPSEISMLNIYWSHCLYEKIILPNGKKTTDETDLQYIMDSFGLRKVKGVYCCTDKFNITPEKLEIKKTLKMASTGNPINKIFIVHGRDEASALLLQKHLTEKGITAEMFEDFKRRVKGNTTVIEELMKIKNEISYAFIIASADDLGNLGNKVDDYIDELVRGKSSVKAKDVCVIKDKLNPRPRQNVIFEYGLFLGVLGREKVECLWDVKIGEEPSDIKGVLNIHYGKSIKDAFPDIDAKIDKIK